MPVSPEAVWAVLADPTSYAYWVVGSKRIRDFDAGWPSVGSKFHHTIGVGPLTVDDHTEAVEADPPAYLELRAKARPVGIARVAFRMTAHPTGEGTTVVMTENPDGAFAVLSLNPLTHVFTIARNAETLMRLEELALLQSKESS